MHKVVFFSNVQKEQEYQQALQMPCFLLTPDIIKVILPDKLILKKISGKKTVISHYHGESFFKLFA